MTIYKVELNNRNPGAGTCKVERYRAVIEAPNMDVAIATARARFGKVADRWAAMAQAMDDRELANLDRAAAWFLDKGPFAPFASGPVADWARA